MKKVFLNYCLNIIKKNNNNITDEKLDEIRYGLEGIYLTFTKMIVIFLICWILGIFREMLLLLIFFNLLRMPGFGLHAKKSWQCWVSSILMFIFFPFLSKYLIIPISIKTILGLVSIIIFFVYAPADTEKHPLVNKKKRLIWKFLATCECIIFVFLSIFIKDSIISNLIIFGIYTEVLLIIPITYKIFKLPYNNYKRYKFD